MVSQVKETSFRFSGRHMLAIMIAFFAVVIGVNMVMAVLANTSWTGLVVKNSYVESQKFNTYLAATRAQDALGWTSHLTVSPTQIVWYLYDRENRPVRPENTTAAFYRPVSDDHDFTVALAPRADGALVAPVALASGRWTVKLHAEAGLDHPYEKVEHIVVPTAQAQ